MEAEDVNAGFLLRLSDSIGTPEPAVRLLLSVLLGKRCILKVFEKSIFFISILYFLYQAIRLLYLTASTFVRSQHTINMFISQSLELELDSSISVIKFSHQITNVIFFLNFVTGWDISHSLGCVLVQYLLFKILSGTRTCVAVSFVFHMSYLLIGKQTLITILRFRINDISKTKFRVLSDGD